MGADRGRWLERVDGPRTLTAFKTLYGFGTGDQVTKYYNRGDLGIGREMHCVDKMVTNGQIACYVKNFAAGDNNTEFQFGLSANIAYANQNANTAFATRCELRPRWVPRAAGLVTGPKV